MNLSKKPYGLVLCGGLSTRMGRDKSTLSYYTTPQCYHVYNILEGFCERVFLSCRAEQAPHFFTHYPILPDLQEFASVGPMAGLLTAFTNYPDQNFLVMGVDYPLVTAKDLQGFLDHCGMAFSAAFFNRETGLYDPMLAFYHKTAAPLLRNMFNKKEYSLQHFLNANGAVAYQPENLQIMKSADTPEAYYQTLEILYGKAE